jgi:hypothetical protein
MVLIIVCLYAQVSETATQRQRDAQRDAPRSQATTLVHPPLPRHRHLGYNDPALGPPFNDGHPYQHHISSGQPPMYGVPQPLRGHSPMSGGPPLFPCGQDFSPTHRGVHGGRGGRRPTIDPAVIGRAVNEDVGCDKESLNRSMKMSVSTMGLTTDFKQWKRSFLTFLSLNAAYLIPQLALGVLELGTGSYT